jgi:hypothetical protein
VCGGGVGIVHLFTSHRFAPNPKRKCKREIYGISDGNYYDDNYYDANYYDANYYDDNYYDNRYYESNRRDNKAAR